MTPEQLASLRESIRMTRDQLAEALGVDRTTIWRWETGATTIPVYLPLALLWIRHTRRTMQGNNYPLMADVQCLMLNEDIDQDTAIRSFGAAP